MKECLLIPIFEVIFIGFFWLILTLKDHKKRIQQMEKELLNIKYKKEDK